MKVKKLNDKFYVQTSDGIKIVSQRQLGLSEEDVEYRILNMLEKGAVSFDVLCAAFRLDERGMKQVLKRIGLNRELLEEKEHEEHEQARAQMESVELKLMGLLQAGPMDIYEVCKAIDRSEQTVNNAIKRLSGLVKKKKMLVLSTSGEGESEID